MINEIIAEVAETFGFTIEETQEALDHGDPAVVDTARFLAAAKGLFW